MGPLKSRGKSRQEEEEASAGLIPLKSTASGSYNTRFANVSNIIQANAAFNVFDASSHILPDSPPVFKASGKRMRKFKNRDNRHISHRSRQPAYCSSLGRLQFPRAFHASNFARAFEALSIVVTTIVITLSAFPPSLDALTLSSTPRHLP